MIKGRCSPVGKALSFDPGSTGSRLNSRNTAMHANGTVHVKSVVGAMSSKFPFKLYLWGYQIGGNMPSVAD